MFFFLDNSFEIFEKDDGCGKCLEGRYFVGDDDNNGQEHGSCTEITKTSCRKAQTVRSSLSVMPLPGGRSGSKDMRRLTLRLLMSYIYGAPSKARNANVVYIWTYVWQR